MLKSSTLSEAGLYRVNGFHTYLYLLGECRHVPNPQTATNLFGDWNTKVTEIDAQTI